MIDDFGEVFSRLRAVLATHAEELVVQTDTADTYYLNTKKFDGKKRPVYFGSVHIKKNYVSFYLMPVYCYPDLLDGISADLNKRMQGKSCFNFKVEDGTLFAELDILTAAALKRYSAEDII